MRQRQQNAVLPNLCRQLVLCIEDDGAITFKIQYAAIVLFKLINQSGLAMNIKRQFFGIAAQPSMRMVLPLFVSGLRKLDWPHLSASSMRPTLGVVLAVISVDNNGKGHGSTLMPQQ
jgi:hypothetical protein